MARFLFVFTIFLDLGPSDPSSSDAAPNPSGGARFPRSASCPLRDFTGSHWKHPRWTDDEIQAFIEIWGDTSVQRALFSNYRTVSQFQWISGQMKARGYDRNWLQCREKAKHLRKSYKDCLGRNSQWGCGRRAWPFFSQLNQFLDVEQDLVVPREMRHNDVQRHLVDRRRKRVRNAAGPAAKASWVQVAASGLPTVDAREPKHRARFPNGTALSGCQKPPLTSTGRTRDVCKARRERRPDVGQAQGGVVDSAAGSTLKGPALQGPYRADPAPSSDMEKAWEECERKAVEKLQGYLREKGWELRTRHSSRTGILQDVLSIVCKGRAAASRPVPAAAPAQGPPLSSKPPRSEVPTEPRVSADAAASSPPPSSQRSQSSLSDRSIRLKRKRSLPARFQC